MWENIAGRPTITPPEFSDPALAPLTQLCWPPRLTAWSPVPEEQDEGFLSLGDTGRSYGDGSGYRQRHRHSRVATWSLARTADDGAVSEHLRGTVAGFFSTVPRGEIQALITHLRHAGPGATYVGDCQHVLDSARYGVPPRLLLARSPNPDLWSKVDALLKDHGGPMALVKVKAHASLQAAVASGASADDWRGNCAADHLCRQLARSIADRRGAEDSLVDSRAAFLKVFQRVLFVTQWAFRYRPQLAKSSGRKRRKPVGAAPAVPVHGGHDIVSGRQGRSYCRWCRREAWTDESLRRLRGSDCPGHVVNKCHGTHRLHVNQGVLWCSLCGAFTTR